VIQLHIMAESCTICGSRSRWPVRKLLDTPSYESDQICEDEMGETCITHGKDEKFIHNLGRET